MRTKTYFLRLASLLLMTSFFTGGAGGGVYAADNRMLDGSVSLSFDYKAGYKFRGLGTQTWVKMQNPEAAMSALDEMDIKWVRVSITPFLPDEQLPKSLTVEAALDLIKANEPRYQPRMMTTFRDNMESLGIYMHLISWVMPSVWVEETSNRTDGEKPGTTYAKPEHIDDYVNLITARLLYLRDLGIVPAAIELTNEPQGAWSTYYSPNDYATLVHLARTTFDKYGLQDIMIDGPGTGLRNYEDYKAALEAKGAMDDLRFITGHVYDSTEALADTETRGVTTFLGQGKDGPIYITEFGIKNAVDNGSLDYALESAFKSLMLFNKGAKAASFWQLETQPQNLDANGHGEDHGMLDINGQRRPTVYAFQALFEGTPTRARVLKPLNDPSENPELSTSVFYLDAGAYKNPDLKAGGIYVLASNKSDQPTTVHAKIQNLSGALGVKTIESVTYSGGTNLVKKPPQQHDVIDNIVVFTVPAKSVMKVTLH